MKTISIIGAGAAGLMVAATILEENPFGDYHIHLFEKNNSPGKKVIISGGGRCNVTTSIEDKGVLATKYTRGWNFIRKSMGKFSPRKCREWFESHGVPLKIQEDLRVFPVSDDGKDIVGVFEKLFAKNRDKITSHYAEGVSTVVPLGSGSSMNNFINQTSSEANPNSGNYEYNNIPHAVENTSLLTKNIKIIECEEEFIVSTEKGSYKSDILIITTGGSAYSHTGSTGDGYAFARALGHSVTKLGPSLSSFLTKETWLHELSGLVFEEAKLTFFSPFISRDTRSLGNEGISASENHKLKQLSGSVLLTHFGISGPLAFMLSSDIAWDIVDRDNSKEIFLAPHASMNFQDWESFLKSQFQNHPKKFIISILSEKISRRFADAFIKEYFADMEEIFAGSISRSDREKISKLLGEGIPITLLERRPGDEFVTAGGVSTDEIDPESMESKIHKNLYFAGEVLNVDGYTGGFSLQICWSSGYAVGKEVARYL